MKYTTTSRKSPNCFKGNKKRLLNQKQFGADRRYKSKTFCSIDDGIIKELTFFNYVCNSLEARNT